MSFAFVVIGWYGFSFKTIASVVIYPFVQFCVIDCFYGDGRGYRGNISTTVSGNTCQRWNAQCPHKHNITGDMYEEIRNSSNFCRNSGGFSLKGPWCFTTNRTVRWEFCNVSTCAKERK